MRKNLWIYWIYFRCSRELCSFLTTVDGLWSECQGGSCLWSTYNTGGPGLWISWQLYKQWIYGFNWSQNKSIVNMWQGRGREVTITSTIVSWNRMGWERDISFFGAKFLRYCHNLETLYPFFQGTTVMLS